MGQAEEMEKLKIQSEKLKTTPPLPAFGHPLPIGWREGWRMGRRMVILRLAARAVVG
jgi:hypothetical protein